MVEINMRNKNKITERVLFILRIFIKKPIFLLRALLGAFNAIILKKHELRFMDIAVDYQCNLRCNHCSAWPMKNDSSSLLSLEEYDKVAKSLISEGCAAFHFTGGEPLLRNDLEDIISLFKPRHSLISVQTNGLLVTEQRIKSLKEIGLDILCVSIDSFYSKEHDSFRSCNGLHKKAWNAIEIALKANLRAMISVCI